MPMYIPVTPSMSSWPYRTIFRPSLLTRESSDARTSMSGRPLCQAGLGGSHSPAGSGTPGKRFFRTSIADGERPGRFPSPARPCPAPSGREARVPVMWSAPFSVILVSLRLQGMSRRRLRDRRECAGMHSVRDVTSSRAEGLYCGSIGRFQATSGAVCSFPTGGVSSVRPRYDI